MTTSFQAFEDKIRSFQQKASHSSFTPGNGKIFQFCQTLYLHTDRQQIQRVFKMQQPLVFVF